MLWILACASVGLLIYQAATLIGAVLMPLLANRSALQTDFHYYYDAATRFSHDRSLLYLMSDDVIAGFAYPPPAILPFMALAGLPLGVALLVFTVVSYATVLLTVWLWRRVLANHGITAERNAWIAILAIVLALGPTYMTAVFGQVNGFVLVSAVAFAALAQRAPIIAGAALACGAALKMYPALMLWIGTWDRRAWRAIGCAVAAGMVVIVVSLSVVPVDAYRTFLFEVLPARSGRTAIHITNQSLVAFLERFRYEPALFLNWTGQQAVAISQIVVAVNFGLLGASLVVFNKVVRTPQGGVRAAAVLMAMVAIFAPLGWGHTYLLVLPLVMMQLIALRHAPPLVASLIVVSVIALMIPAGRRLPIDAAPAFLQNIVYSRYLLAAIALIATSTLASRRATTSTSTSSA